MTKKDSMYMDKLAKDKKLKGEIINLLKANGRRMEEEKVLTLLGITQHDIPWGYNIGWARCSQIDGIYNLVLQEYEEDEMKFLREQKIDFTTVRLPITEEYELVLVNYYMIISPILEVTLFVNDKLYGEPILDVTWQDLIELILQVSRGELSKFIGYKAL